MLVFSYSYKSSRDYVLAALGLSVLDGKSWRFKRSIFCKTFVGQLLGPYGSAVIVHFGFIKSSWQCIAIKCFPQCNKQQFFVCFFLQGNCFLQFPWGDSRRLNIWAPKNGVSASYVQTSTCLFPLLLKSYNMWLLHS